MKVLTIVNVGPKYKLSQKLFTDEHASLNLHFYPHFLRILYTNSIFWLVDRAALYYDLNEHKLYEGKKVQPKI